MTALPLGILPLTILWTLLCLGLGAWTMRAFRRPLLRRAATAPPSPASTKEPSGRMADYEAAVGEVLEDGVITQDEDARLRGLRAKWGLSPADHVHAVARTREPDEP